MSDMSWWNEVDRACRAVWELLDGVARERRICAGCASPPPAPGVAGKEARLLPAALTIKDAAGTS